MRWFLLISVLFLAVVLSAARILLPEISQYRAEIVSSISASIGKPIEMDRMSAGLNGFRPEVVLNGVKIIDPGERKVLLRFDQLRAGLNLKEFLLTGSFQPRWVTIRGARLSIRRQLDGSIRVAGLDSGAEMPKWIFEEGRFELLDSEVDWRDLKYPALDLHFSRADIRLLNLDHRHKVAIDADLPRDYGKSLTIRMDYEGDIILQDCCSGRIYVKATDIRYGKLFAELAVDGYRIAHGRGGFRVWTVWEKSALVSLSGDVDYRDGVLSRRFSGGDEADGIAALPKLAGDFHWTRSNQGWNLSVRRLALNFGGESWPLTDFGLGQTTDLAAGNASFHFNSSYLRLEELRQLIMDLRVLVPDNHGILAAAAPGGEIYDLKFEHSSGRNQEPLWSVCGRFEDLSFRPRRIFPGAKNLSGAVCGDQGNGRIVLAAAQAELEFPEVFRAPIGLTELQGDFFWQKDDQAWRIESERVRVVNPALTAETRVFLQLPVLDGEPFLDLQASFKNVDGTAVHRYLPVAVLNKPLIKWLDAAFVSGTVTRGGTLFRGPLKAFPFRGAEGVFETLFYTRTVILSYHPDWPVIHSDLAEVRFFQAGMSIRGAHADVMGASVKDVRVRCADFETEDYLNITGVAEGTLQQSVDFLKKTPLAPLYEPLLEFVSLRGDNRIDLELKIPILERIDNVVVNGTVDLKMANLNAFGVPIDRLSGTLDFSRERIHGTGIQGEMLGSPVQVEVSNNKRGLAARIHGATSVEALAKRYFSSIWKYFAGKSDYSIDLQIPKLSEKLYADIDIHSNLRGISMNLPEPLQKPAALSRGFGLKIHLEPGQDIPAELTYENVAQASLTLARTKEGLNLEQGRVKLGRVSGGDLPDRGLSFYANLKTLDLKAWKNVLASLDGEGKLEKDLGLVDVQIDKLAIEDLDLGRLVLKMHRNDGVWEGVTDSDLARGRFSGTRKDQKPFGVNAAFDYLRIPEQDGLLQKTSKETLHWDPARIVDLDIRAEHLFWKQVDYGKLELASTQQSNGMKIDRLNVYGNGLDLNLSGYWTASESVDQTSISGDLKVANLGQFLARLGKSNVIGESSVHSRVALKWNDPLYDLSFATLSGAAQVEFGAGRLLTVEPGIGRVFGLFNLDGLKNLMLFDFGKLFGPGLAFEEVKSSFQLTNGRAKINLFTIDAVPAEIIVAGEIDLVREQLDDIVTVVPKGMVAAGASMLLTQELPGTAVDGLINRQYQVIGKWDDPEIVRLPGTGKPL